MLTLPLFTNPKQAIKFIRTRWQENDPFMLCAAFSQEASDFWKEHFFTSLR
jgi:hypothetical protein